MTLCNRLRAPGPGRRGEASRTRLPISMRSSSTPSAGRAASTSPGTRPGHGADPAAIEALGAGGVRPRRPGGDRGHRRRPRLTLSACSAARRRRLGREAQLVSDQRRLTGQPRHLPRASPSGHERRRPAQRPFEHDRRDHPRRAGAGLRRARARRRARRRALPYAKRRSLRHSTAPRGPSPPSPFPPPTSARSPTSAGWRRSAATGGCRWSSTKPGERICGSRRSCRRAPWSAAPTWSCPRFTSCSAA